MKKLQGLWVALLLLSAGAPGAETVPLEDGEKAQAAASTESVLYFPDYVDGGGWSVQLVLNNVDPSQSAPVEVEVYDQQGRPAPRFFGSGNRFEIPARGSRVLRSPGGQSVVRGWIEVETDSAPVHGLLTYRHAESGIEVGVRPVPLNDHFALYVEESSDIGTGLAIFKPDSASQIEFRLRDEAGFDPLGRVLTQGNFQQRAEVIPEWFSEAGARFLENFRGLLFLRSADGSGFAPMGLRGGKRKGSLSAVPVIPIGSDGGGGTLYFPDYVDGGGWSVQLVLNNVDPNRNAPVEVEVYDQQGRTVPVFFDSVSNFEIPAGGSRVLRSPGGRSVVRGWIEVETESASVHGLLTYRHAESGIEVGVEPVPLSDHFALYVEESSEIGTGLAIFKPDAATEIEFEFRDEAGRDLLGEVLTQGDFQQRADVLPDWFAGVDTGFLEDFRGLLFLRAADGSGFAPMGLRGGKRKGSLSAVPVIPILSDVAAKMYWTDFETGKIQRANLDGTQVEYLITGLEDPVGLALDPAAGKMYWTDRGTDEIQRANLDGSGVEDLVTGLSGPLGIALDRGAGKMYWVDRWTLKIQRANLDGSGIEDLVTGLRQPEGIALDRGAGKMYWTAPGTGKIQRADLDGSGIEDLVTGLRQPEGIGLDRSAGKMYWTAPGTGKIQRADLDGSGIEDLVTGLRQPEGIALDRSAGKMYWTAPGTGKIQRANLDGSGVEDLVTGLRYPIGIALGPAGREPGGDVGGTAGPTPDLVVVSPAVSDNTLTAGQSFELQADVRNQGGRPSTATTLRYYLSNNPTISTNDTPVGTDAVSALAASGASAESIRLTVPSSAGTYHYGACVDPVRGEVSTNNNCSAGVQVTVSAGGSDVNDISTTGRNQILVELRPDDTTPANLFDLNGKTLVFTPAGGGRYAREVTALQWEEDIGKPVGDGDRISLENFDFEFAGQSWDAFYVNSHGVLTFGGPLEETWWVGDPLRSIANRFITAPTISPLFRPGWAYGAPLLNVAHWPDRVVVTWTGTVNVEYWVHRVSPEKAARVQAILRADGRIVFSYVDVSFDHGIVGVFPRSGTQPAMIDLSQSDSRVLRTPGEVFHYPSRPDLDEISCRIIDALGDNFDLFVFHSESPVDGLGQAWRNFGEVAKGIGRGPASHLPCGESRLKGRMYNVLWMQNRYVFDARRSRNPFRGAKYIVTHEFAHTWGAYVSYNRAGQLKQLTDDGIHWSRWLHAPAAFHPPDNPSGFGDSVLGGRYWRDNGDGTYASEFGEWGGLAFSWLDLYLMGLADASEVPDTFILRNPKPVGRYYTGEKEIVSIEQIITAEGPREPSAAHAQKDFNAGFVYLLEPGQAPSGDLLDLHARQRDKVVEHWTLITGGRSRLTTTVGPY